jgi:hypothetical protein
MGRPIAYNATVVARTDLTDALATFLILPDQVPRKRPWFTAGQYCVIGLNNSERPELGSVRRAMSIASAPETDGPLEFYIRYVGLTGTIRAVLVGLLDRGFIPQAGAVREALRVPSQIRDSLFYELYDPTPVIDIDDASVIEPLRARIQAVLAKR